MHAQPRFERFLARQEPGNRLPKPPDDVLRREHKLPVCRMRETSCARTDLSSERLLCRAGECLGVGTGARNFRRKHEPVQPANHMAFNHHLAALADIGFQGRIFAQPAHEHAGATVDEAFHQTLMQRVRQLVLDRARDSLPVLRLRLANPADWQRTSTS